MPELQMKDVLLCSEHKNLYDEDNINSIFDYAVTIEGKTLLDILIEAKKTEAEIEWIRGKEADKGLPGKIIEATFFGYELNSRQEADFYKVGVELKSTPADTDKKSGRYKSGETISITQIDFRNSVEKDFAKSHLYEKLSQLIVIFYYRNRSLQSKLDYTVFYASLFKPTEEDLEIIKSDYQLIISKIERGQADKLSRADGTYLSTAPKGKNKKNLIMPFYGGTPIVKRCFTFRKEYVNVILAGYYKRTPKEERIISDVSELKGRTFADVLASRFSDYIGLDIWDIVGTLNIHAEQTYDSFGFKQIPVGEKTKSTLPTIVARLLGLKKLRAEEFIKAGIIVKTIEFNKNGTNTQNFRLDDADFIEICDCEESVETEIDDEGNEIVYSISSWENSELYSILDGLRYLFVVFQEDEEGDTILKGVKLWSMSDEDIEIAHKDWDDIRKILMDGVKLSVGEDGRTYNNFPGASDARLIHLRPHGEKAFYVDKDGRTWGNGKLSDSELLPDGRRMTKQSYWLKNSYIKEIVKEFVDEKE
ncbi:MAG: hypothetical protein J5965_07380 [Aeriscardovia sp.]|nr:hypothetical protein [Aeriscardovia sp.]